MDEQSFRYALGHFASGVTVVSSAWGDRRHATTVSAFSSVSLHPPLVLVCLDNRSRLIEMITSSGAFVVTVLGQEQELTARHYSSRIDDRLAGQEYRLNEEGQPILVAGLATLECRLHQRMTAGDHEVMVGEVLRSDVNPGKPLLYYRGGYASLDV